MTGGATSDQGYECAGRAAEAGWRVQLDPSAGGLATGSWTGRAASSERAEAVARMTFDESWKAITGRSEPMPPHLAASLETQPYGGTDASKVAARTIGDPFWQAARETMPSRRRLDASDADAIMRSVCAGDAAIHRISLESAVTVTLEYRSHGGATPRKYAQVRVANAAKPHWPVAIGRATEVALLRIADEAGPPQHADPFEGTGSLQVAIPPPPESATLKAALAQSWLHAPERVEAAALHFERSGSPGLAEALRAQARMPLQDLP